MTHLICRKATNLPPAGPGRLGADLVWFSHTTDDSDRSLLVKVVTPSDQQLVRLIADYYDGLGSELDWAGVRIERRSRQHGRGEWE